MTKKDYEIIINHNKKTLKHPNMDNETKQLLLEQIKRLTKEYKDAKKKS